MIQKYSLLAFMLFFSAAFSQKLDMEKFKGMKPRSIGPAAMSGRITAIDVVVSNPDIMFAGAASGGLWKTESGGVTWESLFDEQPVLSIGAVAVQQDNPAVVWVGTGEGNPRNSLNGGNGVYKSLDGGKSWRWMGLEKTRHIHRLIIDPRDPNTVYVGAIGSPWGEHPERGVFKTTDGGTTWQKILYENDRTGCADLVMDPSNPNKLYAAMWEHRRWPWFFKSGGPGSSLQVTVDGGKTWKKLSSKDGLPEGELGRIGLAVARSSPNVVYALIESSKNALYRSDDGGGKFSLVSEVRRDNNINARPFYFWEIHVDPQNENRIYSLHVFVTLSEDGGKTFKQLVGYKVHLDHHAWWIHPNNPDFIVDGNDGGLNISHDRGKTWEFIDNIPVGQFYHINVDMDHPYNVYGGMQDNGSWAGPAYVWKRSGIRNSYWQEISFGDGFDVSPDPENNRYGYSMSQEGYLVRYDRETGQSDFLRPTHPDADVRLRFNWNSGLAQDPFSPSTIYYGSQYLHKSSDRGATWEIISPDLTTNDPQKQKQGESGGITMDATGAENHTTILTVAPSTKQGGVIWVGTDDGNVQLTRDGGKTWTNLTSRITGLPKRAWIPQIHPSPHAAGEAFVVANQYRQFDYRPYLFHTKDFGQTWTSIVNPLQVGENNYTLSVAQDPVERKLLFLGTENGLWVSIDEGKNWTRWTSGFPHGVPTMDLVVHPREHDLVIGTFGRAIYVLDDVRPLRDLVKNGTTVLNKTVHLFTPPDAYLTEVIQPSGPRFDADAVFNGQNRPLGAMISYAINKSQPVKTGTTASVKPDSTVKFDSLTLEIYNMSGDKIRTIKQTAPDENGVHRIVWNLTESGEPAPAREKPRAGAEPNGPNVIPGTYKVRMLFGKQKDSVQLQVKDDPRYNTPKSVLEARYAMMKDLGRMLKSTNEALDRLRTSKSLLEDFEKKLRDTQGDANKTALERTKAMKDSVNKIFDFILGKEDKRQGITEDLRTPVSYVDAAENYLSSSRGPINATDQRVFDHAKKKIGQVYQKVNYFYGNTWKDYQALMEKVSLSPFKTYSPLGFTN